MGISAQIRALLAICNLKNNDLEKPLNMSSKQSLSNKFINERWSASDLVTIAEVTGCKLAFILPNGERIVLNNERADSE